MMVDMLLLPHLVGVKINVLLVSQNPVVGKLVDQMANKLSANGKWSV
jgi:hypothetical protein